MGQWRKWRPVIAWRKIKAIERRCHHAQVEIYNQEELRSSKMGMEPFTSITLLTISSLIRRKGTAMEPIKQLKTLVLTPWAKLLIPSPELFHLAAPQALQVCLRRASATVPWNIAAATVWWLLEAASQLQATPSSLATSASHRILTSSTHTPSAWCQAWACLGQASVNSAMDIISKLISRAVHSLLPITCNRNSWANLA